jgi:hypothetical protein
MKTKIKVEQEVDVKVLSVSAGVRYWEDGEVNGESDTESGTMPCKKGEMWCPEIDIETGRILNWTEGVTARVHYKVCDAGVYILSDANGNTVSELEGYVPECMCPAENGYGDYIIMEIDAKGMIKDWSFGDSDISELLEQE